MTEFGFLYTMDKLYGGPSDGEATCRHIENPMEPYEFPVPEPIVCNEDEMEEEDY